MLDNCLHPRRPLTAETSIRYPTDRITVQVTYFVGSSSLDDMERIGVDDDDGDDDDDFNAKVSTAAQNLSRALHTTTDIRALPETPFLYTSLLPVSLDSRCGNQLPGHAAVYPFSS